MNPKSERGWTLLARVSKILSKVSVDLVEFTTVDSDLGIGSRVAPLIVSVQTTHRRFLKWHKGSVMAPRFRKEERFFHIPKRVAPCDAKAVVRRLCGLTLFPCFFLASTISKSAKERTFI